MRLTAEFYENETFNAQFEEAETMLDGDVGEVILGGGIKEEVDPTVPEWAKQPEKPKYHITEIEGTDEIGGGGVGEDVSGTWQIPYEIDKNSLVYTWLEPVQASEGAEIFNSYSGDRDETGVSDCDRNVATGFMAQASGFRTQARGNYSKAGGWWTIADGQCSVAEGLLTNTAGHFCHSEGTRTSALNNNSHSEGDQTQATARQCHSEGANTKSTANCSHSEGYLSVSSGIASHAEGYGTIAAGQGQTAMGKYNIKDTSNRLIVGIGTGDSNRKNGFTVSSSGAGWFAGAVTSTGADYAEYFEWTDGNPDAEDRIGLMVTLEGEKIRLANDGDDVIGIISSTAALLGDNAEYEWKNKYLTDNYGRIIYDEPIEDFVEFTDYVDPTDPKTWVTGKESAGFSLNPKLNPNYDPTQEYINRANRKEWDIVGMIGKLHVNDDGSAVVGGYVKVGENGIATMSAEKTNIRVMKRITDNIILVLMK